MDMTEIPAVKFIKSAKGTVAHIAAGHGNRTACGRKVRANWGQTEEGHLCANCAAAQGDVAR